MLLIPAGIRLITRSRRVRALGWKVSEPSDEVTARVVAGSHPAVAAAWAELDDVLVRLRNGPRAERDARALARRLTERYEFGAETGRVPSRRSPRRSSGALYARDAGRDRADGGDLREVRRALAATVSRRRRVRALLLPPSTLRRLRHDGRGSCWTASTGWRTSGGGGRRPRRARDRPTRPCGRLPFRGRPHGRSGGRSGRSALVVTTAPALFHTLHEAASIAPAGLLARNGRAGGGCGVTEPVHAFPAGQTPQTRGEHDHETADAERESY